MVDDPADKIIESTTLLIFTCSVNAKPMKEQSLSTARSLAFTNTIVEPWSKTKVRDPQLAQVDSVKSEFTDLKQLINEKDKEIDSLRMQLQDKDQLLAEVEATVETLKEKLMKVYTHNYL